jgi:hypothetical protein
VVVAAAGCSTAPVADKGFLCARAEACFARKRAEVKNFIARSLLLFLFSSGFEPE